MHKYIILLHLTWLVVTGSAPEVRAEPAIAQISSLQEDADVHAFHLKASLVASGLPLVYHSMKHLGTSPEGIVSFRAMAGLNGAHYTVNYDPATYEIAISYQPPPHQVNPVEVTLMILAPGAGKIVSRGISRIAASQAGKRTAKLSSLASKARTKHILYGDMTGGGHLFGLRRLLNGKTKFPVLWSRKKVMHAVTEVATSPRSRWIQQTGSPGALMTKGGAPVRWKVEGVFEGVRIRVIVQGADLITAFPIK